MRWAEHENGSGHKVLVAEDDPDAMRGIAKVLRRAGYEVETAGDGLKAMEKLEAEPFDVVVADWKMPGADGFEVLRKAKALNRRTEVLIITGYATVDNAITAWRSGASEYIPKPYSPSVLTASVERAFRRREVHTVKAEMPAKVEVRRKPESEAWTAMQPDNTVIVGMDAAFYGEPAEVVSCALPRPGDKVEEGKPCGRIVICETETCSKVSDMYGRVYRKEFFSPVSGTVVAVNEKMENEPWEACRDALGDGWLFRVAPRE